MKTIKSGGATGRALSSGEPALGEPSPKRAKTSTDVLNAQAAKEPSPSLSPSMDPFGSPFDFDFLEDMNEDDFRALIGTIPSPRGSLEFDPPSTRAGALLEAPASAAPPAMPGGRPRSTPLPPTPACAPPPAAPMLAPATTPPLAGIATSSNTAVLGAPQTWTLPAPMLATESRTQLPIAPQPWGTLTPQLGATAPLPTLTPAAPQLGTTAPLPTLMPSLTQHSAAAPVPVPVLAPIHSADVAGVPTLAPPAASWPTLKAVAEVPALPTQPLATGPRPEAPTAGAQNLDRFRVGALAMSNPAAKPPLPPGWRDRLPKPPVPAPAPALGPAPAPALGSAPAPAAGPVPNLTALLGPIRDLGSYMARFNALARMGTELDVASVRTLANSAVPDDALARARQLLLEAPAPAAAFPIIEKVVTRIPPESSLATSTSFLIARGDLVAADAIAENASYLVPAMARGAVVTVPVSAAPPPHPRQT